jgi:GT2 family glycosyltransferase
LENAATDFIVYIDADTIADHCMLGVIIQEFKQGDYAGVGGQGIETNRATLYDLWRSFHAHQSLGKYRNEHKDFLAGLCMGYYCSALSEINGFDATFRTNGEDIDLGIRLNKAGYKLLYTPEARVYHQRKDDHASLRRMMYWWYYWAFIAKKKNHCHPWTLLTGTIRRMIWSDTLRDLIIRRNLALAKLDIELSVVKIDAILSASRSNIS